MKREHLFEAIGLVDDRLGEEAADARRTAVPWKKWLVTAACLAAVIGLGSISAGTLLRGCGASGSDSAGEALDSAAPESAENGTAGAPAEVPESAADGTPGGGGAGSVFDRCAGPVLPLTASGGDTLRIRRDTVFRVADDAASAAVTDRYEVENPTEQDQAVTFYYPLAADWNGLEEAALQLSVDGAPVSFRMFGGRPLDGTGEAAAGTGRAGGWADWEEALAGGADLEAALRETALDQQVTVWSVTDLSYDRGTAGSGASLAVWFEQPEGTAVLTYGMNGMGTDGALTAYDFFVASPQQAARHDLIFLGSAPEAYTVQGYADGGLENRQDDITGTVRAATMTLGEYLRSVTEDELEYETAAALLEQAVLEADAGQRDGGIMLEHLLSENRAAQRVFYAAVRITLPAGERVELAASFRKDASLNFYTGPDSRTDLYGFDLATALGSGLTFEAQTAALILPERDLTVEEDSFGFPDGGPVTLDPAEPYYHLELCRGSGEDEGPGR